MRQKQQGFTIVELVVVIILLGILAATALPRFMDVDQEAHAAAVQGVTGGLQTGISLYHAQWIADNTPAANTPLPEFAGLRVNAAGFPYGLVDNTLLGSNVDTSADCQAVFQGVMQGGPSITNAANAAAVPGLLTDWVAVQIAPANCEYYYLGEDNTATSTVPLLTYDTGTGVLAVGTAVL